MLDDYFERGFSTSTEGDIIYAPFGYRGKHYIIPDQEEKQIIKSWCKRLRVSTFVLLMCIPMINMLVFNSLYIEHNLKYDLQFGFQVLFITLCVIGTNQVYKKRLSRYASTARAQKISFREAAQKSAQSTSYLRFFVIEFFLLFPMAQSLYVGVLFPNDPHIGNRPTLFMRIIAILFFVCLLIVFIRFLYLLFLKIRAHSENSLTK